MLPKKLGFFYAIIFFIVINLIAYGWGLEVQRIYAELDKPDFAPPTWVFGTVWPINVAFLILGNVWAYNLYQQIRQETSTIAHKLKFQIRFYGFLQVLVWINYCIFQYISFGTEIPALFFWPTFSMLILALISLYPSIQIDRLRAQLKDPKLTSTQAFWNTVINFRSITFTFLTLTLWLILASNLGYFIWMNN